MQFLSEQKYTLGLLLKQGIFVYKRSYSYTIGLHVFKSWKTEVGLSHRILRI